VCSRHVKRYLQGLKCSHYTTDWTISALEERSNLEKHVKWNRFHQCPWKTNDHHYAKEQIKPHPESAPEAITWVEINSSRVMIHVHTGIMITWHKLAIYKEHWIFPPQTIDYSWHRERGKKRKITAFQEAFLNGIIRNTASNGHWSRKYFKPHMSPYT
jgi:hypothetical protein